ncbi:unnamed protein product [Peronospora belbahrii]|uniref:Uncharacterized protein n=1 Tax=Peronospora belbahrii TaxID=622444 RepID=A0ABN8D8I8_9STRA|nr:unnamed protein product [Peronospora belbahrii]
MTVFSLTTIRYQNSKPNNYLSRWHEFLDIVLKHCAAGARITGYLARELDLTRSGCQVMLSRVQVDVPEHCNYFPNETALVPVITVTDPVIAAGASDISLTSPVKLLLPQVSKRFQRAFNSTTSRLVQALHADTKFSRERQHIAEIPAWMIKYWIPERKLQSDASKSKAALSKSVR